MARKWNLFGFLEKKIDSSEIVSVTQEIMEQIAFKELALHIGVSYIANTLSKCEFRTYENGKEVKDKLYYMLNVSPNPNQNSSQFINKFIEQYYYTGHALIVPQKNHIYCADSFDIEDDNPLKENIFYNITFNCQTLSKKYKASDVFYMKLDNKNVKMLIDSIYAQYGEVIAQAIASYKRTNGAKYKLLLESFKAGDAKHQQKYEEIVNKQLKPFIENDNAVYPQNKGYELQEFSTKNPQSADDIISMRKEIFEVVAQALKIPQSMMNGNITNMNEIVKVYLSICIDPLADMISEELTRKYYSFKEWNDGCRVVVDTSCINHIDILEVANEIYNAIGSGATNIDEIRRRLNMTELGTDFSTRHFVTKNYVFADEIMNNPDLEGGE